MLKKFGSVVTNNFGLKVLSIIFAIIMWLVVVNIDDPKITKTFTTTVSITNESAISDMGKYYEVVDGKYKITYKPAKKLPIEEFLRPQKRFKHMFKPGNEWMIEEFQKEVDARWQELLDLEEITNREQL